MSVDERCGRSSCRVSPSSLTLLDGRADLRSPWETVGLPRPPFLQSFVIATLCTRGGRVRRPLDCDAALQSPSLLHFEMSRFFENGHEIFIFKNGRQAVTDERRASMPRPPPWFSQLPMYSLGCRCSSVLCCVERRRCANLPCVVDWNTGRCDGLCCGGRTRPSWCFRCASVLLFCFCVFGGFLCWKTELAFLDNYSAYNALLA